MLRNLIWRAVGDRRRPDRPAPAARAAPRFDRPHPPQGGPVAAALGARPRCPRKQHTRWPLRRRERSSWWPRRPRCSAGRSSCRGRWRGGAGATCVWRCCRIAPTTPIPRLSRACTRRSTRRSSERWWRRLAARAAFGGLRGAARRCATARAVASVAVRVLPRRAGRGIIESALRAAYPNVRLLAAPEALEPPPVLLRLKKHRGFIRRTATAERYERDTQPTVDGLLRAMAATSGPHASDRPDAGAGRRRVAGEGDVQAQGGGAEPRAARARRDARPLDRGGGRAARRPRDPASGAVLRGHQGAGARTASDSERIAGALRARPRREPADRARHAGAPRAARTLRAGACDAARATPSAGLLRDVFAAGRAGRALAASRASSSRPCRWRAARCRSPRPRPRSCGPASGCGTLRDALGPVSIHRRAAAPERRRAGHRRAGQVELPRRERRGGSPPRALRGDRAGSRRATPRRPR